MADWIALIHRIFNSLFLYFSKDRQLKFRYWFVLTLLLTQFGVMYGLRESMILFDDSVLLPLLLSVSMTGMTVYYCLSFPYPEMTTISIMFRLKSAAKLWGIGFIVLFCFNVLIIFSFRMWHGIVFFPDNFSLHLLSSGLVLAICASAFEEMAFRGSSLWLIKKYLKNRWLILGVMIAQALAFAYWHVANGWYAHLNYSISLFCAGMLFVLLGRLSNSLWLPIGAHTGWNVGSSISFGINHKHLNFQQGIFLPDGPAYFDYAAFCIALLSVSLLLLWLRREKDSPSALDTAVGANKRIRRPAIAP